MSNPYSGTQTEKNLLAAFAGESEARNKYTYFASRAKKDGYEQIAALFLKTAENEKEHAKLWFKELNGIGNTAENLKAAAEGVFPDIAAMIAEIMGKKAGSRCYPAFSADSGERETKGAAFVILSSVTARARHRPAAPFHSERSEESELFPVQ